MAEILVVDDDQSIATAFQHFLDFEGHVSRLASNAEDAVRLIAERRPNLVMMDVRMPGTDGLQALQEIRKRFPDVHVVIMTAYGTSQTSIDAIRAGAFDYITKPLDLDELRVVIDKALAAQRVGDTAARDDESEAEPAVSLVGEAAAMLDVYKMIGRLATNDVPALVVGERGTGKQLVIATIHDNSARREEPFVTVDCVTLSEAALEEHLFGARAGTVHLAGIEGLPPGLQARVARALDERPRAATGPRLAARVIASSDHDLGEAVAGGTFSRQLFDALSVITLRLPPLAERREDIPLLVRYFVQRFNSQLNRSIKGVDDAVAKRLQAHNWPGNVGELESVIKRACILAPGDVITMNEIGERLTDGRFPDRQDAESALIRTVRTALHERLVASPNLESSSFHDIVDLVETALVKEALTITKGNQVKAADLLGVNRATLRKKMTGE